MSDHIDPDEVRAGLPKEEQTKFDNIMSKKKAFQRYLLVHSATMIEDFGIIKEKCSHNYQRSLRQIKSGGKPVCRFCPCFNTQGHRWCRIRDHLDKIDAIYKEEPQ